MTTRPDGAPDWLDARSTESRGELKSASGETPLSWEMDAGRLRLAAGDSISLEEEASLHLSRSRVERADAESFMSRLLGRPTHRHWLHVELRSVRLREGFKAAVPEDRAAELLDGLPWMERAGTQASPDSLMDFVAAWSQRAPYTCSIAAWTPDQAVAPEERGGAEGLIDVEAPIAPRPQMGAFAVFRNDWTTNTFFALIFPLFFAVPFLTLSVLARGFEDLLIGLLGLVPLFIAGFYWVKDVRAARLAARLYRRGVQVEGRVEACPRTNFEINNQKWYRLRIEYEVDGMRHTLETPGYPPGSLRYGLNDTVILYVNPHNPSVATWERPIHG